MRRAPDFVGIVIVICAFPKEQVLFPSFLVKKKSPAEICRWGRGVCGLTLDSRRLNFFFAKCKLVFSPLPLIASPSAVCDSVSEASRDLHRLSITCLVHCHAQIFPSPQTHIARLLVGAIPSHSFLIILLLYQIFRQYFFYLFIVDVM